MVNPALRVVLGLLAFSAGRGSHDPCTGAVHGRALPVDFAGGLMFVRWHMRAGNSLRFFLDTGGNTWLFPESLTRVPAPIDTLVQNGYKTFQVHFSSDLGDSLVLPVTPGPAPSGGWTDSATMMVSLQPPAPAFGIGGPVDGVLGGYWFADRVWVLDYPAHEILYNGSAQTGPADPGCWVPLGFQVYRPTGQRTTQFPRIAARIDGEEIQFLLDTGARTILSDSAWQIVGREEPRQRGASYITKSRFDEWHRRHPDWLTILHADAIDSFPMIRVPRIRVGRETIGPVWFTQRPDRNFSQFMSRYTDQPVEGALGGSAWKGVTLVLDYPRARAAILSR